MQRLYYLLVTTLLMLNSCLSASPVQYPVAARDHLPNTHVIGLGNASAHLRKTGQIVAPLFCGALKTTCK